jgi:hypothetical protein
VSHNRRRRTCPGRRRRILAGEPRHRKTGSPEKTASPDPGLRLEEMSTTVAPLAATVAAASIEPRRHIVAELAARSARLQLQRPPMAAPA